MIRKNKLEKKLCIENLKKLLYRKLSDFSNSALQACTPHFKIFFIETLTHKGFQVGI